MLNAIFTQGELTVTSFLICTATSMILGTLSGLLCMYRSRYSQSFVLTLAVLPVLVQVVIMLVNGNIGAGVAVAGAFSLVRFRSAQGSAREILLIFLSMSVGLATGMGYVGLAFLFFLIAGAFLLLLQFIHFGSGSEDVRVLKINVPEDIDYDNLFDDVLERYTANYELDSVKTAKMGTLYELDYKVSLKNVHAIKDMIDELRCRNGNLEISYGRPVNHELL